MGQWKSDHFFHQWRFIIYEDLFTGDTSLGCPQRSQLQCCGGGGIHGAGKWLLGNFTTATRLSVRLERAMLGSMDLPIITEHYLAFT